MAQTRLDRPEQLEASSSWFGPLYALPVLLAKSGSA